MQLYDYMVILNSLPLDSPMFGLVIYWPPPQHFPVFHSFISTQVGLWQMLLVLAKISPVAGGALELTWTFSVPCFGSVLSISWFTSHIQYFLPRMQVSSRDNGCVIIRFTIFPSRLEWNSACEAWARHKEHLRILPVIEHEILVLITCQLSTTYLIASAFVESMHILFSSMFSASVWKRMLFVPLLPCGLNRERDPPKISPMGATPRHFYRGIWRSASEFWL